MGERKESVKPRLVVIPKGGSAGQGPEDLADASSDVLFPADIDEAARLLERGDTWLVAPADPILLCDVARRIEGLRSPRSETSVRARTPRPKESDALYDESVAYVEAALSAVRDGDDPDVEGGRLIAERMHLDMVLGNRLVNRSLEPHGTYDLARHSVNVAVLAGKIALGMVTGIEDAVAVVHAGLLHDVGMARLPRRLLENPGTWSEREREALRRHPEEGAAIVARSGPRYEWLRRAVLQEHERLQGQGYPSGLRGDQIDPIARILGVADVFEALSHPRTYRSPFTALEALERVAGMQDEYFSRQVVASLINEISAFPLDSYVQLSTGEIGRVVATDPENMLRPRVEVVWDAGWNPVVERVTVDLSERADVTVARALLDAELPIT